MTRFGPPPSSERMTPRSARTPRSYDHRQTTGTILDRTDVKELSPEVEAMRAQIQRLRQEEKEKEARALAQRNKEYKARISSAGKKGRDSKELTPEQEAMRAEVEQRRLHDKAYREAQLAKENKEKLRKLRQAGAHGRDVKELSAEEEALRQAAEERRRLDKKMSQRRLAEDNKLRMEKLKVAGSKGRDEKSLTPQQEAARAEAKLRRLEEKRQQKLDLAARNREIHERLFPDVAFQDRSGSMLHDTLEESSFVSSDQTHSAESPYLSQDHSLQEIASQIGDLKLDAGDPAGLDHIVRPALDRLVRFQEAGYDELTPKLGRGFRNEFAD